MAEFKIASIGDVQNTGQEHEGRLENLRVLAAAVTERAIHQVNSPDRSEVVGQVVALATLMADRIQPPATALEQAAISIAATDQVMAAQHQVAELVTRRP